MPGSAEPLSLGWVRLWAAVGLTAAIVLIKLFDPAGAAALGQAVGGQLSGDSSGFTIAALGHAISSGDSVTEVFANIQAVFKGEQPEDLPVDGVEEQTIPSATPTSIVPTPSPSAEPSPSDSRVYELNSRSMFWRYNPQVPVTVSEDEMAFDDYGLDDTLPLPFGMSAPTNVDFTRYTLSFAYTSPVAGVKSSGFGYRMHPIKNELLFHYGTDFGANQGTPIVSFADGTVSAAGKATAFGNYVMVAHADGLTSVYAHCLKVVVKKGAAVKKGQKIAEVGSTGLSTGAHLHFELRRGSTILDPQYYLE
ncbi:hypothetical protein FACS1894217_09660 [Clostridia bacterium]|nr:hypothetical protein FACS1894217_09660 [Clostridia bacterium]